MAVISSIIAAVGVAAGVAGTVMQMRAAKRSEAAQRRAESIREAQSNLESRREKRSVARQALIARASALSNAEAQGAMGGSGIEGGLAQIGAQGRQTGAAINQNMQLGAGMFAANRDIASANSAAAFGSGISSLGGALVNNAGTLGRIGNYFTGTSTAGA